MSDHLDPAPAAPGPHEHGGRPDDLLPALHRSGLSMTALYLRYVALGGSATSASLARHVAAGEHVAEREHDLAVLALNERFLELEVGERLPYRRPGAPT